MAPKKEHRFVVNEKVMALDKGTYYSAKILKAEESNGVMKYFIHFLGWNRKWDRWTDASMMRPENNVPESAKQIKFRRSTSTQPDENSTNVPESSVAPPKVYF